MAFQSEAVSLEWERNNMVLKRGASSLVINAEHVQGLRTQENEDGFNTFFRGTALQNREARRVFSAWERKDDKLLSKIYAEMKS